MKSKARSGLSTFIQQKYFKRKLINRLGCSSLFLAALFSVTPLFLIFTYVLIKGAPALNWSFITQIPKPVGEVGGGMANALTGTGILVGIASLIGIPWGVMTGLYLSEFGRNSKFGQLIRFTADMLSSTPSIIIGLFIYAILVMQMKRFSALAGGLALGIIMVPTIARVSEEILKLVPDHIREAGLALGLPRWKVILFILLKGCRGPILTGVILALARVAGETAPLLFTAFNNQYWSKSLDQPTASLPVQIYTYAISPFEDWHNQAWAGAFVLVMAVFFVNLFTRGYFYMRQRG